MAEAEVGVEPTSNGAGSPHACAGWSTEAPVTLQVVGLLLASGAFQGAAKKAHLLGPDEQMA